MKSLGIVVLVFFFGVAGVQASCYGSFGTAHCWESESSSSSYESHGMTHHQGSNNYRGFEGSNVSNGRFVTHPRSRANNQESATLESLYGELWPLVFFISILITWGVGLMPPLLIRFIIVQRPISKGWAIGTAVLFLVFNVMIFTVMGSESKTHGALGLVAFVSYMILRKGANSHDRSATTLHEQPKHQKDVTNEESIS